MIDATMPGETDVPNSSANAWAARTLDRNCPGSWAHDLVRIGHQRQRRFRMPGLTAGFAASRAHRFTSRHLSLSRTVSDACVPWAESGEAVEVQLELPTIVAVPAGMPLLIGV
jgi:hypothetical protein